MKSVVFAIIFTLIQIKSCDAFINFKITNDIEIIFENETLPNCQIYFSENKDSFNISYWDVVEFDSSNKEIWKSSSHNYSIQIKQLDNSTINQITFTFEYENKGYISVQYSLYKESEIIHPYGDEEILYVPPLTIKVTLIVNKWNFSDPENKLGVVVSLNSNQKVWQNLDSQNFAISKIAVGDISICSKFLFAGTINENKVNLSLISGHFSNETFNIKLVFPTFTYSDNFTYDPDFSIVLPSMNYDSQDNGFWDSSVGYGVIFTVCFVTITTFCLVFIIITTLLIRRLSRYYRIKKAFGEKQNMVNYQGV
jgi:hypothetical protein